MKAALFALSASSLLGSAFSLHARHAAFHEKKDVLPRGVPPLEYGCCKTVVTVTVWEEPEPTTYITTTSTQLNVVTSTVTGKETEYPAPSVPAAPAPPANNYAPPPPPASSAPPAVPSAAPPSTGIITNGNKWAMTYTPYTTNGGCKAAGDVMVDIAAIKAKGFTTVRIYGTDCDGLASVGAACRAAGLKLILGVFIKGDGIAAARPQIGEIVSWGNAGNWDLVVLIVVGNEAIHSGSCDAGSLASFISEAKGAFTAAGQGAIPVTTTETVDVLGQWKDVLCPVIDVTGANIQSFFDGKVVAANAGDFVANQLEQVKNFCPGKPYYNLESGWPSDGASNGASIASPDAQKAAMGDIVAKVGDKTVVFSFQDDAWKAPGIEQHFGCAKWF